jgi:hypothetical protein
MEFFKSKKVYNQHHEFTDITVQIKDNKGLFKSYFTAHKHLRAKASPVWYSMLKQQENQKVLKLDDLNRVIFGKILNFIHEGEICTDSLKIYMKQLLTAATKVK